MTTFTKQTTITWTSDWGQAINPSQAPAELELTTKVTELVSDGKTVDRHPVVLSTNPLIGVRYWVNQAAAEEYVTFITALAAKYSLPLVSAVIEDYAPAA